MFFYTLATGGDWTAVPYALLSGGVMIGAVFHGNRLCHHADYHKGENGFSALAAAF